MNEDHPDSHTKPELTRPDDFFEFWADNLRQIEQVDTTADSTLGHCLRPELCVEYLTFQSLGGAIIHGYLLSWRDDRPRPLVVHAHGYGSQYNVMEHWAEDGVDVVGFDARGFGRSKDAVPDLSEHGYVTTGIESPETSILRGAVCDYIQAYRVAHYRLSARVVPRTIFCGTSFAGGLAVQAAAVSKVADLLAVGVPTFGWAEGRRRLAHKGSSSEINNYIARHPDREAAVMNTLRYFDTMNFADQVRCPTLVGVGRRDEVVPAATVYAVANHLSCFHEVREFPVSHSIEPEEILWQQFESEWLGLLKHGIDTGFGTRRVRRIS